VVVVGNEPFEVEINAQDTASLEQGVDNFCGSYSYTLTQDLSPVVTLDQSRGVLTLGSDSE